MHILQLLENFQICLGSPRAKSGNRKTTATMTKIAWDSRENQNKPASLASSWRKERSRRCKRNDSRINRKYSDKIKRLLICIRQYRMRLLQILHNRRWAKRFRKDKCNNSSSKNKGSHQLLIRTSWPGWKRSWGRSFRKSPVEIITRRSRMLSSRNKVKAAVNQCWMNSTLYRFRLCQMKHKSNCKIRPCRRTLWRCSSAKSTNKKRMSKRNLMKIDSSGSLKLLWHLDTRVKRMSKVIMTIIRCKPPNLLRNSPKRAQKYQMTTQYPKWWRWSIQRCNGRSRMLRPKRWHRVIILIT